jgi:alpha-galactosidase
MLDAGARYRVSEVVPDVQGHGAHNRSAPLFEMLRGEGTTFDGAWLAHAGLPLPRLPAETCFIARISKV